MGQRSRFLIPALLTCVLGLSAAGWADDSSTPIEAYTKPSKDVIVSFVRPGRVIEMPVKEGDEVTEGQIVARQDNSEEVAQVLLHKMKADDMTQIEVQENIRDQADVDYKHMMQIGVGSQYEKDHARLQAQVEGARVKLARFQQDQEKYEYQQAAAADEKTKLHSPIAGRVEQTMIKVGESSDVQNMKAMRIVNINPLWVEAPVPFAQAQKLKNGDIAQVKFSTDEVRQAKVIHVGTVADSATEKLLVRIEVGNEQGTPAGERVTVSFPSTVGVASVDKP